MHNLPPRQPDQDRTHRAHPERDVHERGKILGRLRGGRQRPESPCPAVSVLQTIVLVVSHRVKNTLI